MIAKWLRRKARDARDRGDWMEAMKWANMLGQVTAFGVWGALGVVLHQAWDIYLAMEGKKQLKDAKLQALLERMKRPHPRKAT